MSVKALEKARSSLKKAFGFSAFIGALIVLFFLQSDNDKYAFWLLLIPMVMYMVYGNQLATKYKYLPDFADSVYYLGFIFTLMSLLGATIFEKLSADPSKTVSYFGMALSTTILGLIYRTYHSQFTDVNIDPIEKAKEELSLEVESFKMGIDQLIQQTEVALGLFKDDVPNKLNDNISEIHYAFRNLSENINTHSASIATAFENTSNTIKTIERKADHLSENIVGNSGVNGAFDNLLHTIEATANEMENFSKQLERTSSHYSSTLSSIAETNKILEEQIDKINSIFAQANQVLESKLK